MNQVITFIDHRKFFDLLKKRVALSCNFSERIDGRTVHLRAGSRLFYVCPRQTLQGVFRKKLANESEYLLVPDHYKFNYVPACDFKILFHTGTPPNQIARLKKLKNCKGLMEDTESGNTAYAIIAEQIKQSSIDLSPVWEAIGNFDSDMEYRRMILHECLTPEGAARTDRSSRTREEIKVIDQMAKMKDALSDEYALKLAELRNLLFPSK